uniref:Uncharacterized protein n=1 Tax=Arundo donax TaxID=35708 RepID=A0A0A8ZLU2_ARUDO
MVIQGQLGQLLFVQKSFSSEAGVQDSIESWICNCYLLVIWTSNCRTRQNKQVDR